MRSWNILLFTALAPGSLAVFPGSFFRNGCFSNACGRAIAGNRGKTDASIRSADCSAFLSGESDIPPYAGFCEGEEQYISACSCLGVTASPSTAATSVLSSTTEEVEITWTTENPETISSTTMLSRTVTATVTVDPVEPTSQPGTAWTSPTAAPLPSLPTSCLNTTQAKNIVDAFSLILTNTDRKAANKSAQLLISDDFLEMSDSINSLIGLPLGNATFPTKASFQANIFQSPAIPSIYTLDIFNDCRNIAWSWSAMGVGSGKGDVRGINLFLVTPDLTQIVLNVVEFNSIAWAVDVGKTLCNATTTKA